MFNILALANDIEASGEKVYRLEIGDTSLNADPQILELLNQIEFTAGTLSYSPSLGESQLRKALADKHNELKGTNIGIDNVAVTPANAAISQLMMLLADSGDTVVLPDPCFPTYRLAAKFARLRVKDTPLARSSEYQFDIGEIRALFASDPSIKMMLIDSPSNPLGIAHSRAQIEELARACQEFSVSMVVDETYRNLIYDNALGHNYDVPGITWIYSLSKDAGVPGLRIGSVVGSPPLIAKLGDFNSMFFSCLPKHIQLTCAKFLNSQTSSIEEIRNKYRVRLERVYRELSESQSLIPSRPNSSIYCFVDVSPTGLSGEEFATQLLVSENVAVCPGNGFGRSGENSVRISVSGDEKDLTEGLKRLVKFASNKG